MNWVTTNIRLPEEVYMDLKMEAAKRRISLAALIRERVKESLEEEKQSKSSSKKTGFKFLKLIKNL